MAQVLFVAVLTAEDYARVQAALSEDSAGRERFIEPEVVVDTKRLGNMALTLGRALAGDFNAE